jgi:AcrR family transcriptional regulator
VTVETPTKRMSKRDRRHQLLDVAAGLLAQGGTRAATMERVAEAAGVSKALPYAHFANAEDLLIALYRRSSVELGESVWAALEAAGPDEDLAEIWVRSHFHCGARQGVVFAALITPGSAIPSKADRSSTGEAFVGRILRRFFQVEPAHARVVASMVLGAFLGASNQWINDVDSRPALERAAIDLVRGVVQAAPKDGRQAVAS